MGNSSSIQRGGGGPDRFSQLDRSEIRPPRPSTVLNQGNSRASHHRTIFPSNDSASPRILTPSPSQSHTHQEGHVLGQFSHNDVVVDSLQDVEDRPLYEYDNEEHERNPAQIDTLGRSASTVSRLGSRVLPNSVVRNLLQSGEETAEEGEALRQGVASRRRTSVWERTAPVSGNERFSISGTIRRHRESRIESRRRSIRGPFPLGHSDHQLLHHEPTNTLGLESASTTNISGVRSAFEEDDRRSRFARMRNSILFPLGTFFDASRNRRATRYIPRPSTPHPGHRQFTNNSEQLLPSASMGYSRSGGEETPHDSDGTEPETRNNLSSSRISSGMSTIRRIPNGFRSRSRLIRRGEHPPLSQVLQLAAAAIAAQLGGQVGSGSDGLGTLGRDAFDGSIQNFVQTLQDAASAQAGEDLDINATDGDLPPVNFMRVFQFPNDENGTPIPHTQAQTAEHMHTETTNSSENDRSVTLVLVGVRSMPNPHAAGTNEFGGVGPSLDTLLSLPFLPPTTMFNNGGSGALFRRTDTRTRNSRRHSLTNFNFPAQYESQRHHRTRSSIVRPPQDHSPPASNHNIPTLISESPPGPHPPPSTPADIRSGQATPSRRPSSASGARTPLLPNLNESHTQETLPISIEPPSTTPRQRRRSDSEFARRPELGSGAARRNGMVEPDRPAGGSGRSWLIYVVGTNVSPDHPAFTMPSLFTDSPTYEDMQMLSTLLGPVKPPVASQDDITNAGGLYRLSMRNNQLIAEPLIVPVNNHVINLVKGDRCLVCLCDYEPAEEVRQLSHCRHVFHRECIDEWLTTGRNSCPMCRGQGVQENSAGSSSTAGEATA